MEEQQKAAAAAIERRPNVNNPNVSQSKPTIIFGRRASAGAIPQSADGKGKSTGTGPRRAKGKSQSLR